MKLIVNRNELLSALNLCHGVINPRSPKPVLANFMLSVVDGKLFVQTTDLELSVRQAVNQAQIEGDVRTLIPQSLLEIVKDTPDDTLTIDREKESVIIKSSDAKFKLFVGDEKDYPEMGKGQDPTDSGTMRFCDFKAILSRTIPVVSRELESRYAMNGALLVAKDRRFDMICTDGRRLARSWHEGMIDPATAQALVPTKALKLLAKLETAKKPEESPTLTITFAANWIRFECDGTTVVSNLIEGQFPPYDQVIPKDCDKKATFDRESLIGAVRRAGLFINDEAKGVRFEFGKSGLKLSSIDPSAGESTVRFPCKYEGADIDIGFNPSYMLDGLKSATDDEVTLEMTKPSQAGLVSGMNYKYLLMPINIKQ